jgi:AraC-like DNA-binding protein
MLNHFFVLSSGIVGIVVSFTVARFLKSNKISNFYLLLILLYVSFSYVSFATQALGIQSLTQGYVTHIKAFSVFIFPLMFLYFESLLKGKAQFKKRDLLHFIFPCLYFFSLITLINKGGLSPTQVKIFYGGYALFCLTTLLATLWMLRKNLYYGAVKEKYGHREWVLIRNWILTLLMTYSIVVLRMVLVVIFELRTGTFSALDSYIWVSALIWLFVFVKILNSPEILYGYHSLEKTIKSYRGNSIPTTDNWNLRDPGTITNPQDKKLGLKLLDNIPNYIQEIERMGQDAPLFMDPKFDLQELALAMNVPKSHLVHLFKYHCRLSFAEYRKMVQINHAVTLINKGYLGGNTLNGLAHQVGFSSYNPFYLAFKKYTGNTPNSFASNVLSQQS